ncbi:MAG TPA: DUF3142 domain-containing protein [Caulobacteraceae bacterium]|nr:DUF3142 domain-containing protein [Caulobacteraceae bacterium]
MRSRALALAAATWLGTSGAGFAATVDARDYDAFWLWAGVRPQPEMAKAKVLYVLQGEVVASSPPRLVAQGGATPALRRGELWLVYRVQTLAWTPLIYAQVAAHLRRWRAAGNPVVGVQIDFDARTRRLGAYAAFLADLKSRLPPDCKLGVTGLLDWSSQGDPAGLKALTGVVDELVLQTYQGRRTIPGYGAWLARLDRLGAPFRIGLVQGGEWTPPESLARDPDFRGYVVFLRNPTGPTEQTP